jgi:hypothetical protein
VLAAVIGALVIGAAFLTIDRLRPPAVGTPNATPTPSPIDSPNPSRSAPVAMPDTLLGDWQAVTTEMIPGAAGSGEHLQLSLDWDGGEQAWIQRPAGDRILLSDSVAAPAGEIRLVATQGVGGCAIGDAGRYAWDRSPDGTFLDLTVIDDPCAARAAAFGRTWVHSLSAVTDGGSGVLPWSGRWIRATLPQLRLGLSGASNIADLHTIDQGDPARAFIVMGDPNGASDPCVSDGGGPRPIVENPDGFADYLRDLPGATVTSAEATVAGVAGLHLTVELARTAECPLAEVVAFLPRIPSEDAMWSLTTDDSHSLWVIPDGDGILVFWYAGDGVTPAEEQAVIDSLAVLDELPTP